MVLQLPARQAPKRVILVTPSDRAGSWESFRPLCSVRNEKKPELYKRIMSGLQESMLDLKNTPTALISSLRDEDEIFGLVMSIVLVGRQQDSMENIEMVLTIFVDDEAESWPDIPRDVFSGQKLTLLGDDLTQLFPNQFLNYRQLLLKSSSALSAIGQMIQPGKFVSLTGTRMMLPFEFIRSADASDCQKICCSDLTQPNSSLMVLDETCPVGINLLQKLRTSDKPTSS
ncbi:Oidioi.mRNA.OKI2018_I69.PAR.g10516.t1.cds [Oikopleura dioica]|uniref:Oidioi.mRNA.OKI2018_I69.PAR.g10516.t1.cds n=1 Tax=Oikopleura dioica TaxID=34765 RepID=A0ABN7RU41_OIKDI|nr:Oidioi.mRNA.OKI2018_I69.PAR.g10516.t1.cds [Oikopleura dioica]